MRHEFVHVLCYSIYAAILHTYNVMHTGYDNDLITVQSHASKFELSINYLLNSFAEAIIHIRICQRYGMGHFQTHRVG